MTPWRVAPSGVAGKEIHLVPADFRWFMASSLGLAAMSALLPFLGDFLLSVPIFVVWALQLVSAVRGYGTKRLWALVGLPFAGYWLFWIATLMVGCSLGYGCL
jgi:hypothetical protein